MTITKEYIEGLKNIIAEVREIKDEKNVLPVNYLLGYVEGLINLYETENETKSN